MFDPDGGTDPEYSKQFHGVQLDWCVEMFGYIFAAAEVGVKHDLSLKLQVIRLQLGPFLPLSAFLYCRFVISRVARKESSGMDSSQPKVCSNATQL
jgi:hypothetical protein